MVLVPAAVVAATVWALVTDDKVRWTVIAGATAAVVGAFAPSVMEWVRATRERDERRDRVVARVLVADVPESVVWLLHPQAAVVGFVGRGWLLQALGSWCADPATSAVRLLVGAGGVGKTRLARHFADRLSGWVWWPVAPDKEAAVVGLLEAGERPARLLLTVDYAETRDPQALAHLLCVAQRVGGVRVLLLARSAGLWWSSLSAAYPPQAHLVDALTVSGNVIEVPARIEGHTPRQIVAEAVVAFADRLRRRAPDDVPLHGVDADAPVLRLHALALLAVLSGPRGDDRYDVLAEVLGHEARYWRHRARRDDLPGAGEPGTDVVLRRLVAVAALLGADDREQTVGLVRRVPGLGGAVPEVVDGYVSWLYGLYPQAGTGGGLGMLQPDLLAEDLAVAVLRESSPAERRKILHGLARGQAARALTVLSRARSHQSDAAELIDVALKADLPVMTEAVLQIGLQFPGMLAPRVTDLLVTAELDPDWAEQTAHRVPHPSIEFGGLALALTAYALRTTADATTPNDRASLLSMHALRLVQVGRRTEALAVSQEAVDLYRELATANRDAHLPNLAASVSNHAVLLSEARQRAEALAISQEAVDLCWELVAANRDAHLPNLAASVNNHALRLSEVGRHAEALDASQEAVDLRRELVAANRDAYLSEFAMSMNNHALRLEEAGQRAEALAVSQEALDLCWELVATNRDAYLPNLAMSVNSHALQLQKVGRWAEALDASQEALDLYRELAATNRDAYLPNLAASMNSHALRLKEAGQRAEALDASQEALDLYRELAATNRDAYLPNLTRSMNNHAVLLSEAGQRDEALAVSQEAVELRRELAASNRDAYLPNLAASMKSHALRLEEAGQRAEALAVSQEAVDLYRELVATNRDAHLLNLARSLWNVGYVARILEDTSDQILEAVAEGVRYFDELTATDPQTFTPLRDAATATLTDLQNRAASQHSKPTPPNSPHINEIARNTT
ncbi:tetratricopeptide repeat protein [Micromonospora zamorensis]|uniref:tetratricopeptide repeat protein n=1 Tax=Micromonospora zamorensis TaxID=709883 RepID=UPI0038633D1A|nr:tetratricopeptide repeat protein [Micromonospora zamorensis]